MFSRHVSAATSAAHRILLSLGLAAGVLTSTLGAPAPALAQGPVIHDHRAAMARIEVVVNRIHILDDRDPGAGEFKFELTLTCFATPSPCLGQHAKIELDHQRRDFSAATGESRNVGFAFPEDAPTNADYEAAKSEGYPFLPDQSYELSFTMHEKDTFSGDEDMGSRTLLLRQENNWGIGTHNLKATRANGWGDYEFEVEIRPAFLPDLHPEYITVKDPGGTVYIVCAGVRNLGRVNAEAFSAQLLIDGERPHIGPDIIGVLVFPGVLGRSSEEKCYDLDLPRSGQHRLEIVVDPERQMTELDETNNRFELPYTGVPKQANASTPQQSTPSKTDESPSAAQADLTVSAVRVNGRVPDGKDDCKDGKNAVTVVVKNTGTANAESFAVRLDVDGDAAGDESMDVLEAGKEREVRFGDVRLKKGDHKLVATADPKNTVAESKDDNNAQTVPVTCRA
jgi:hypothetical protein